MNNESILNEVERLIKNFQSVPSTRRYWLIRTLGGKYFDSYKTFNYIALGHNEISYSAIDIMRTKANNDGSVILKELKNLCRNTYDEESRPGLIASQIYKFIFEIKKGDVVVIPSENSEEVAIGIVQETPILEVSSSDIALTDCPYLKRKSVKWEIFLSRQELDPYLYKVLQAHQAINEISRYSDIIERTISNFYIKEDTGNLILNVATNEGINAVDLFQLGYFLLNYSDKYFKDNGLPFNINDVEVKINLNSKGKIQFKARDPRTVWMIALIVLALNGGGLKFNAMGVDFDLSTDGLVKNVIEYQNNQHDREMTDQIIKSLDSLKIETPDDAVKVFEQFSINKK